MSGAQQPGRVVAAHGRHYVVELGGGAIVHALPRGKKSTLACGDRVRVWVCDGSGGAVEVTANGVLRRLFE